MSPSAVVFPALPSGTRVPGTLATSLLVGHRLRSLAGTRPLSTEVSDLTEQLQSLPSLLNHLHPEGLGSARHYTWRHRLLRPQLPISAPPLDFPCGYTSGPAIRDSLGWSRDLPHFARWSVSPVAVGTGLSASPPHRPQRTELPYWVPTLGLRQAVREVQLPHRLIRVIDARKWQPVVDEAPHPVPWHTGFLAPTSQIVMPQPARLPPEAR